MIAPIQKPTKRAHFIPQVYSGNFCTDGTSPPTGYLYTKSKCAEPPVPVQPKDFGLKNYYYAFEKEDGTRDTQTLEGLFQVGETDWPALLAVFRQGLEPYPEHIDNLCTFVATMRVRVPNFRMQIEERRAEGVRATGMALGRLDKRLNEDFQERLLAARNRRDKEAEESLLKAKEDFDNGLLEIAVDPQVSIRSVQQIEKIREEFLKLKWSVLENGFEQEFVTTDNPVVYYDLERQGNFVPYQSGLAARGVEVIFPMTKTLMLIGNRIFPRKFAYARCNKVEKITELNHKLILSAEQFIYSGQPRFQRLVQKYASVAPRVKYTHTSHEKGVTTRFEAALGPPHKLPKWKKANGE